jgi:putative dimethyl sulfoxide reductase chaperone
MSTEMTISLRELTRLAELRNRVYGFLAYIYTQLPDRSFVAKLTDHSLLSALDGLAPEEMPQDIAEGLLLLKGYLAAIGEPVPEQLETELAVERTRLLRGLRPGYGPPPPYESVYLGAKGTPQMQATMAVDVAYAAEGMSLSERTRDQPDFIGFELDFLRHLTQREADAWEGGRCQEAVQAIKRERAFLEEHAGRWIPRFCELMDREARVDFYKGVARITKGFLEGELEDVGRLQEWGLSTLP